MAAHCREKHPGGGYFQNDGDGVEFHGFGGQGGYTRKGFSQEGHKTLVPITSRRA
jgi:hypothetical protein